MASAAAWPAGDAKIAFNRAPATALSSGIGYFGSDGGASVDLHDGRSLFLIPDCSYATAPGQQQPFGTNASNPSAPRARFLRNLLLMASAYDLEAAAMTSWARVDGAGNPSSFFPDVEVLGQPCHRWPFFGWCLDDVVLIVGGYVRNELSGGALSGNGRWACLFDNISGDPNTWTVAELGPLGGGLADVTPGTAGAVDLGDGHVLLFGQGPGPDRSLYRIHRDKLKSGDPNAFFKGEWWEPGDGWRADEPEAPDRYLLGDRPGPRGQLAGFPIAGGFLGNTCNDGSIHRRPDGRYQWTGIFHFPFVIPGQTPTPAYISYALTPGTSPAPFPEPTDVYAIPSVYSTVYASFCHPQLTWPGKGPNDQAWSYFGGGDPSNPVSDGIPKLVKALAVT